MSESLMLKAIAGEQLARPPVWFMRQAGRFLPEYREIRSKNSMLDVIRTPELAAEVTLQPIRRFNMDAAIIFADILNPLIGMGIELDFVEGKGPVIEPVVRTVADIEKLVIPNVEENSGYTLEALKLVASELAATQTLIGFAGAPFTLSSYLVEGQSSKNLRHTKELMFSEPEAWKLLQEKLVTLVSDYLVAQANAGAQVLQIFDSWLGVLGPREYETYVAPYLKNLISTVKSQVASPVIFFATGIAGIFPRLPELGADAYGVDWRMSLRAAQNMLGQDIALQGNLDPLVMAGPWDYCEKQVKAVLEDAKEIYSHIFNLGHGILPHTPIDNVSRTLDLIREV